MKLKCGGKNVIPWSLNMATWVGIITLFSALLSYWKGIPSWFYHLPIIASAPTAAVLGALLGSAFIFGFVAGYCIGRASHLKTLAQHVCVTGVVEKVNNSEDYWYYGPFWDPDRSIDLVVHNHYLKLIEQNALFIRCNSKGAPLLHIEISSHVSKFACIGGVVGALVGSVLGPIAGVAAASLVCGAFSILCFLIALIIAIAVSALLAEVGGIVGGSIGKYMDSKDHLLQKGEEVESGTCLTAEGRWVTDLDHGWNEIHPVIKIKLHGKILDPPPFLEVPSGCLYNCPYRIRRSFRENQN